MAATKRARSHQTATDETLAMGAQRMFGSNTEKGETTMSDLSRMVDSKLAQWHSAAILAAIQHGKNGGEFTAQRWANGKIMVQPVTDWSTAAHAIPLAEFEALRDSGWSYSCIGA